jgi:Tol biopolymer transport system component
MNARRSVAMVLVWLCGVAGGLLLWSAPALAQRMHVFNSSFGSEGTGSGQFKNPGQLAVSEVGAMKGDVYVIDVLGGRVEVFSATGAFISEFNGSSATTGPFVLPLSIAVDNSTNPLDPSAGDVYVLDSDAVIDKFSASGVFINQVTPEFSSSSSSSAESIAVGVDGTLYVGGGYSGRHMQKFNDAIANEFISEITPVAPDIEGGKVNATGRGVSVNSEGDIYDSLASPHGNVTLNLPAEFNSSGGLIVRNFDEEEEFSATAVDESSNDVYVDNLTSIAAYGPTSVPIERFGAPQLSASGGVAVNSATGTVYASNGTNQVDVYTAVLVPDVSTGSASNFGETSVTVSGVVNPDGLPVSSCVFEYGTTTAYGQEQACSTNPGSGDAPVAVSANLSGLERLTSYHFRLKVSNANGSNVGIDKTFTTPEPVAISDEGVSDVSAESALFSAQVDPGGSDTTFHFEYGTSVAYGESVPVPDGDLGAGTSGAPVSVRPEGLAAGTTYHVRLVASNALGVVYGPDLTFTTQAPPGGAFSLPDDRQWEMVSPPKKYGGTVVPLEDALVEASEDGSAISYLVSSPIVPNAAGNPSPAVPLQVLSGRGAGGGWSTEEIGAPISGYGDFENRDEYFLFSSDLSSAVVKPYGNSLLLLSPEATGPTSYLRDNSTGSYTPLASAHNALPGSSIMTYNVLPAGGTPDLSHILLASRYKLTENAIVGGEKVNTYEWAGGHLKLVDVLPNGEASPGGGLPGRISTEPEESEASSIRHAVSNDGSKVFWDPYPKTGGVEQRGLGPLYMRDTATEQTVQVDAPAPGVSPPPSFAAEFELASTDGSKVFFIERGGALTSDSKGGGDLYVYDTVTGTLTDLTGGGGASGSEPGGVQNEVLGASEDGSIVYIVAAAKLASGAEAGQDNLYVASETGSTWSTRFIAVLSGEDRRDWADRAGLYAGSRITSRVSPNGRYVAFMSQRSLTGYDNRDINSGVPDEEVFLYDEATSHLACASCNPTGERPTGIYDEGTVGEIGRPLADLGVLWSGHWLAAILPGRTPVRGRHDDVGELTPYQQRYLDDEGQLFFNGFDPLASLATNGKANVYEYEPAGVGSCTRPGGCVGLISSGTSSEESVFMDASENGGDAFFVTSSRLAPQDVDTTMDMYDAHVCSPSAPCAPVPVSSPPCSSGDACKAAPSPQPAIFGAPASATFSGKGNLPPQPAKPVVTPRTTTRAQKLARALRACAKQRRRARAGCERQARRRYGAKQSRAANATRKGGR